MKRIVLVFGSIAGLIVSTIMVFSMTMCYNNPQNYENGMLIGYGSMILAFSLIFIGVKSFRDKHNDGLISFGKAFRIGLYITLIASTFYVAAWMVDYYLFMPDFMEHYTEYTLKEAQADGATEVELEKEKAEMAMYSDMYKNPLFIALFTYTEILPVGLLIALVTALVLKRKTKDGNTIMAS